MSTEQLNFIASALSQPPYRKSLSAIQLHDLGVVELFNLVLHVVNEIQQATPNHANDSSRLLPNELVVQNEIPPEILEKVSDFLRMLKYRPLSQGHVLTVLSNPPKEELLNLLHWLLKDQQIHKKRAYLSVFLSGVDIPPDLERDEAIISLQNQLAALQTDFKSLHQHYDGLTSQNVTTQSLKKEITMMEEERQLILGRIGNLMKRVEGVRDSKVWLEKARTLRVLKDEEVNMSEKIKEQKHLMFTLDQKLTEKQAKLNELRAASSDASQLLPTLKSEASMNRYLASEKLPKSLTILQTQLRDLQKVVDLPTVTDSEIRELESDIKTMNEEIDKLGELKNKAAANSGKSDDKLALFRQQLSIITHKKEATADKLRSLSTQHANLQSSLAQKKEMLSGTSKVLKGDEFKKFVGEVRGKSVVYKRLKNELSELVAESGVLGRTEEILLQRKSALSKSVSDYEARKGIQGYHKTQDTLEKVSEKKSELDEMKGKTLEEIGEIVKTLVKSINDKKTYLSPIIQELRTLRVQSQELEQEYTEKKRIYDTAMAGLETENKALENEVKDLRSDIDDAMTKWHLGNANVKNLELVVEKVTNEMKSYIGSEDLEVSQKLRGFKSYRDAYQRRLTELESQGRNLRDLQKEVKSNYEPSIAQMALFNDVKKLLSVKMALNERIINSGGKDDKSEGVIMKDRLVL